MSSRSFKKLQSITVFGLRSNVQEHVSMLQIASDWLLWTSPRRRRHVIERASQLTVDTAACHFYLAFPLQSFDAERER